MGELHTLEKIVKSRKCMNILITCQKKNVIKAKITIATNGLSQENYF